jgi:hypothetical protein
VAVDLLSRAASSFCDDEVKLARVGVLAALGAWLGCGALINLVDVSDCATTISTLKGVSSDFAADCGNGGCISCSVALKDNLSEICDDSLTLYEAWVNCVATAPARSFAVTTSVLAMSGPRSARFA